LAGFSRERSGVLLGSLRGNVFVSHGFFEGDVVGLGILDSWRKR